MSCVHHVVEKNHAIHDSAMTYYKNYIILDKLIASNNKKFI